MPPDDFPEPELVVRTLTGLDIAAIAAYFAITFGIAWWFGRKQKSTEDYFVGSRRMPWFAVGLSILATLFSTLSYLGVPGEMISKGIAMFAGQLALPAWAAVITLVWIPFFMRLRLTSAYEYLERRFSYSVRLCGAGLFLLLRLGWMSMVIYAASMALDRIKGDDLVWLPGRDLYYWIGLIGVISALYTAIGGIQAMIWTDVLQCLLLLAGVLLAIGYVMTIDHTFPWDWWRIAHEHSASHTRPALFSWDVTVRFTIVTAMMNAFFWSICTHGSDQVVLQRYFSTASLSAARRSYFSNMVVDLLMVFLLSMAGLALLAFFLNHRELLPAGQTDPVKVADRLFPHFLGSQLPAGCVGLVMAAFLCDAIQTLESGVNAITAVATNDVLPRLRSGRPRKYSELAVARIMTVVICLLVTANAYFVVQIAENGGLTLVDMMPKFFNMFVGPLAALFFVGMFVPFASTRSVLAGLAVGLATSILWSWFQEIFHTDYSLSLAWAISIPCTTTFVVASVLGLILGPDDNAAGREYVWWKVVRRKVDQEAGEKP